MSYRRNSNKRKEAKRKKRKKELAQMKQDKLQRTKKSRQIRDWAVRLRKEVSAVLGPQAALQLLDNILTIDNINAASLAMDCGYKAFKFVILFSPDTCKIIERLTGRTHLPQDLFFTFSEIDKIQNRLSARGFEFEALRIGAPTAEERFLGIVSGGAVYESGTASFGALPEWKEPLVPERPEWTPLYLAARLFNCDQKELLLRAFGQQDDSAGNRANPDSDIEENKLSLVKTLLDRLLGKDFGPYYNSDWEDDLLAGGKFHRRSKGIISPLTVVSRLMGVNMQKLIWQLKKRYPQYIAPKPTAAQEASAFKQDITQEDRNHLLTRVVTLLRAKRRLSFEALYDKLSKMNLNARCEDPECFEIHSIVLNRHTLEVSLKGVARETCECDRWDCAVGAIHYDADTDEYYYRASRKTRSSGGKKKISKKEKKKRKKRKRPH
jgi:hypothetical protein